MPPLIAIGATIAFAIILRIACALSFSVLRRLKVRTTASEDCAWRAWLAWFVLAGAALFFGMLNLANVSEYLLLYEFYRWYTAAACTLFMILIGIGADEVARREKLERSGAETAPLLR